MHYLASLYEKTLDYWNANVGQFVSIIITIVLVLIAAQIARIIVKSLTIRTLRLSERGTEDEIARRHIRVETLKPLILSVERYTIHFVTVVIILKEFGVDTSAILASAGVLGLAVGFGAQSLVKDVISGFFLIFDGLIQVNDIITIDANTGVVERIDLRNTQIREFNGRLWTIPNGDLRTFGNFSRGWTRAIANVGMAYEQTIEEGMQALKEVAEKWAKENPDLVVEPPEVQGVMGLDDSSVGLRIVAMVKAPNHWMVERDLRRMIKDHFDAKGVEIPFPRRVVYPAKEQA
jgi:small conductance mechanosensitive channel